MYLFLIYEIQCLISINIEKFDPILKKTVLKFKTNQNIKN